MHKNIITIVLRNLRSRGYSVRILSGTELGFDLLVEGRFRVKVVRAGGKDCFVEGESSPFDTIAIVSFDAAKRPVIMYTNAGEPTVNPREVFGSKSEDEKRCKRKEKRQERKVSQ